MVNARRRDPTESAPGATGEAHAQATPPVPAPAARTVTLGLGTTGARPVPLRWPALREELRLHHGPADAHGHPTWTLQDPVRHRFLRLDWTTYEVLRHWWMADAELIATEVSRRTTLALTADDVLEVLALALQEELVHPVQPPASARQPDERPAGMGPALRWLLHHYLFFRIPLWRPDAVLRRLLPWLAWLGSPPFTRLSVLAGLVGAVGALQHSEQLGAQWVDLLSWRGLLLYGVTLSGVKLAHELGHALVAVRHGCRVPTMGVAFMVLWPMAYTDTTDAWRLTRPGARLQIAAAGVRTELTLAAWATLAWVLLPDGPLRTAAFILATMTWVSTVLINLSPFMRFDGYFLLCDALDQPNLHERSFALARRWLRRTLLGWQTEASETLSPHGERAMVLFALATWGYRLVLFLGIAWMVYHFGPKALGLLLFAVEISWFVLGPVTRELRTWAVGWPQWRGSRRARASALWLGLGLLAGFVPWSPRHTGAALLQPAVHLAVRLPAATQIEAVHVRPGQAVKAGERLLTTSSPALTQQQQAAEARIQQLSQEVAGAAVNPERQAQWGSLQAALATAREQADAVATEQARMQPGAPFAAVVVDLHPALQAGQMSPPARETLMHLAAPGQWQAVAYVDEATAQGLRPGHAAALSTDARPWQRHDARITSVSPHPSALLAEPLLAQVHGGLIDARETPSGWVPAQALYRVELTLLADPGWPPRQWRGHAVFQGAARSTWGRLGDAATAALVREGGF